MMEQYSRMFKAIVIRGGSTATILLTPSYCGGIHIPLLEVDPALIISDCFALWAITYNGANRKK
jgi:hypothetical protein